MTPHDVKPLILKETEAIIKAAVGGVGDDFRKHLSGVVFTPSSSQNSWSGLGGNTHTDTSVPTWVCQLDYVQDWDSPVSLSRFLYENEGQTFVIEFRPRSGTGPSFQAEVSVVSGAIGGQVNSWATTSVSLGSTKPELIPATAA
ncbi:hypothetical protein [Cellulomonas sp. NPDC089187]|uniref:hypothetical protein n=1 Tax=Cellulomonas sp. NPDC089187 TaxID=3154970 RepID=UPI003426BAB5